MRRTELTRQFMGRDESFIPREVLQRPSYEVEHETYRKEARDGG